MKVSKRVSARPIPVALSADALYGKATVYAGRALKAKECEEEDAYQLWATMSLELLGKYALARVHPSLVVDPKSPNSLLEACGISTATSVRTIDANEVFLRLKHVVPGFNSLAYQACKDLADRRNAELHSGHAAYSGIGLEVWEGKLWHAVRLILQATGRDLDQLIGGAAAEQERLIDHLSHLKYESAREKIEHARDGFGVGVDGKKRSPKSMEAQRVASMARSRQDFLGDVDGLLDKYWPRKCPACECQAVLGGDKDFDVLADDQSGPDPGFEAIETTYSPMELVCRECGLRLTDTDELSAGDLEPEIVEVDIREISYEPDYGND